ncbi:MAG: hypothetical protein DRN81_01955 [Thermoproteota archaeon]|nr:MAG: hypothetical protein DRN81_01955 [Candidatus Korarchaeota archaeon]
MVKKRITKFNVLAEKLASNGAKRILDDIYYLERRDSNFSKTLAKPENVRGRLVDWWNEPGTESNVLMQRPSFVLMQLLKRKLKKIV